ncbi:MAG TPA: TrfB-related DNA-binding protein, partial [Pseudoduganella sp.]
MGNKNRLTAEEFEVIRPHLERRDFEEKNIRAIRRVLVDGVMQKDIVAELSLSKEAVSSLISRAWKIHVEHGDRPPGWRKVEVVLPPEYADM